MNANVLALVPGVTAYKVEEEGSGDVAIYFLAEGLRSVSVNLAVYWHPSKGAGEISTLTSGYSLGHCQPRRRHRNSTRN